MWNKVVQIIKILKKETQEKSSRNTLNFFFKSMKSGAVSNEIILNMSGMDLLLLLVHCVEVQRSQ